MRLSSLLAAGTSLGAALAALPEGPFEISVLPINGTEPWATSLATVSHGYVILSLSTGSSSTFTWNAETSRIVPVDQDYRHSSVSYDGSVLIFLTEAGHEDPSLLDGPVELFELDDEVYIGYPGHTGTKYQWNTYFSPVNLPRGVTVSVNDTKAANAALLVKTS